MQMTQFLSPNDDFFKKYQNEIEELKKLKTFSHEKALNQYLASRLALKNVLTLWGEEVLNVQQLELVNYQQLPHFPQYLVSLSHTPGLCSAMLVKQKRLRSIGIDVESLEREVSNGAVEYFKNEWDDQYFKPIALWSIKEAAYKAIYCLWLRENRTSNLSHLTLKSIWVKGQFFGFEKNFEEPFGIFQAETTKVDQKTFIVTQAFIF